MIPAQEKPSPIVRLPPTLCRNKIRVIYKAVAIQDKVNRLFLVQFVSVFDTIIKD
jgi:hypothetical protein